MSVCKVGPYPKKRRDHGRSKPDVRSMRSRFERPGDHGRGRYSHSVPSTYDARSICKVGPYQEREEIYGHSEPSVDKTRSRVSRSGDHQRMKDEAEKDRDVADWKLNKWGDEPCREKLWSQQTRRPHERIELLAQGTIAGWKMGLKKTGL
ncbi:hypothetical protein P170DRAFT_81226 [Aspergillus steynii IBT 23096]|uniref:Uncharacterized protein n=1 Tax=Aspergillus steynii IBT 23096 TaxID=1392250 RepID=A0A2I2GFC6_9EURO|nr:uncharacterized protein P170DRAFT_81226 [Aspergillus steynii IBT 23096]PLB51579.1 hypothetical protein P170DRAFT_81226 [Aspergillus steynii IBT 23096]